MVRQLNGHPIAPNALQLWL